ncbi:MAG: efflux RND transporter periplasmic adaptor subunit [Rhodoferax sp.]|nr:efflux RND transporter periplasmic adaptor subunit [Pseudorhodobacter sp.]
MATFFKAHRIAATVVLVVAAAWVATGEFSAVGSQEAKAAEPGSPAADASVSGTVAPAPLRTVAAVVPVFADHAREIRISGATAADKSAVLAARSDGIVETLGVAQGDEITADTLVLKLVGADVAASVATAEVALAQATQELVVGEKLYARGGLAELELTTRRSAKAAADAALQQAQSAEDRLLLKAPFAGTVDSVDVELGEWVQSGTPIATVLSLDPIVVKAEVSEREVAFVSIGGQARVRLVSGVEMEGTIRHVAKQASVGTRTFVVEVALPNPDRSIGSGMTAEVRLFAAPVPAVSVPRSVITLSEDGLIGLRVVGPDNIAQFAPVTLLDDTASGMIVTGVPADVRIIVAGQDLVRDGEKVTVTEVSAADVAKAQP